MSRFRLASVNKVFKLLNGLSSTKATGLDKISGKVLKAAASTIAPSLTYILNNSILTWPDSFQSIKRDHGAFLKTIQSVSKKTEPIEAFSTILDSF